MTKKTISIAKDEGYNRTGEPIEYLLDEKCTFGQAKDLHGRLKKLMNKSYTITLHFEEI